MGSSSTLYPIKTIVVLVQENRSFDHMLGWFKSLNPEIDGVTGSESNPVSASNRITFKDGSAYVDPDPGHTIEDIHEQVFGEEWSSSSENKNLVPTMEGFAQNAERKLVGMSENVMNGFAPDAIPVFKELVGQFAVCDRWFSSIPTLTQPNRLFLHSATSYGSTSNDTNELVKGYPQKTIFESLEEEDFTFGVYYQSVPATLFYRNMRKLKYIDNFHQFDLDFKRHCKKGKLPNYVVIEPRYYDLLSLAANDDHPSHDVSNGQRFVKEVYEALRASPQWNETLFLIIYDEHGGFYDHVPPPMTGVPNPDGMVGPDPYKFNFDRLGVRVPAILISPWIEAGTVLHTPTGPDPTSQFEHSSICATVKKIFNLKDFLTKRDAWAATFETVLNRTTPRTDCPETLPEPVRMREAPANEEATLTEFQQDLVQMAATLNGDHAKDVYPHKLVENMTVSEAVKYVDGAFKQFCDECKKNKEASTSTSAPADADADADATLEADHSTRTSSKTFAQKLFSCLVCDN